MENNIINDTGLNQEQHQKEIEKVKQSIKYKTYTLQQNNKELEDQLNEVYDHHLSKKLTKEDEDLEATILDSIKDTTELAQQKKESELEKLEFGSKEWIQARLVNSPAGETYPFIKRQKLMNFTTKLAKVLRDRYKKGNVQEVATETTAYYLSNMQRLSDLIINELLPEQLRQTVQLGAPVPSLNKIYKSIKDTIKILRDNAKASVSAINSNQDKVIQCLINNINSLKTEKEDK